MLLYLPQSKSGPAKTYAFPTRDQYCFISMASSAQSRSHHTLISPLLSLPGEIRNKILRVLLTHETPIVIHSFGTLKPPKPVKLYLTPNIIQVCRTLHDEGRSILYGENLFQAHHMLLAGAVYALDSCRPIAPHYISLVRRFHVRVRLDSDPYYLPSQAEAAFSGKDVLEIEVFRSSFGAGDYRALHYFSGIRGVKKVKVHGSIDDHFARWLEGCMTSEKTQYSSDIATRRSSIVQHDIFNTTIR